MKQPSKRQLTRDDETPNIVLGGIPVVYGMKLNGAQIGFWCPFCRCAHYHGSGEKVSVSGHHILWGHRAAHCTAANSPFKKTGYDLQPWPGGDRTDE
jgi:hypothetical protein